MMATPTIATDSRRAIAQELRAAWSRDTSADPEAWSPENPAWGQCAVTALLVQDRLGGELLRCETPTGSHYFNRLADGDELDLTREQFSKSFIPETVEVRSRAYVLGFDPTLRRYETLRERIAALSR